jgi:hypothetical protein
MIYIPGSLPLWGASATRFLRKQKLGNGMLAAAMTRCQQVLVFHARR